MNPEQNPPNTESNPPPQPTTIPPIESGDLDSTQISTTSQVSYISPKIDTSPQDPYKDLAIISLCLALFMPIVGLIIAIVAYYKSKKLLLKNTLAIISIVINSILMFILLILSVAILLHLYGGIGKKNPNADNSQTQKQLELASNIIADKTIVDLKWDDLYTSSDSSWKYLESQIGTSQFQNYDTKCLVTFDQPAGLKAHNVTTPEQVSKDYTNNLSALVGNVSYSTQKDVPLLIKFSYPQGLNIPFETYSINNASGDLVGSVSSYVKDDFGLIVSGVCPTESRSEVQRSVRNFMQSKTATLIFQ